MGPYARVAVPRPVHRTFHYDVPDHLEPWVKPGVRCLVPFGRTRVVGFVVALEEAAEVARVKALIDVLDAGPCLPDDVLRLGLWLSSYYHHPPGETLSTLLPPAFRIASEAVYRLGAVPPPACRPGSPEARLLAALERRPDLPASRVPAAALPGLRRLLESGAIERHWRAEPPAPPRGEEWLERTPSAPPPETLSRAPRQAEALRALARGPVPLRVVTAAGVSRDVIRRLVARGWAECHTRPLPPSSLEGAAVEEGQGRSTRPALTPSQQGALDAVRDGLELRAFTPILLQGVTGSGKTEVYIRAAKAARERDLGALVLVPEIALTPQILGRFLAVFGDDVALLHSGLGERDRRAQWERVLEGTARVALGARSAVFAPVARLGLVVVDEEHEASYKQEDGLRYNAKHAALIRARDCGAVAVLGSATPDLETFWAATAGRYRRVVLPERVRDARPPEVRVVDLRQEEGRRRGRVLLSEPLRAAVAGALDRGEQALLFLNRRGFSPALVCPTCGEALTCRACSIPLTVHRGRGGDELLCHYCGARRRPPETCPECGAARFFAAGAGTQRLVEAAAAAWPGARVVRLDRDTVRRAAGAEVLDAFHRGGADILVGTQMVAKGHHFPRLTVVGVVDADLSLHFPDFRAHERTFQLLTQVAGRAGREERPGVAFFQTRNPHHPVIAAAAAGDYEAFAAPELESRKEAGFPPFRRLALLRISAPDPEGAHAAAAATAAAAQRCGARRGVEVLGPAPAPVERIRGRWRHQVLLRAPDAGAGPLQAAVRELLASPAGSPPGDVRLHVDVDPLSLL